MDEQQFTKPALDKFRQWHFWWLVVFSLFLIITFVYYLPTKFLQQSTQGMHPGMQMAVSPTPAPTPVMTKMTMSDGTVMMMPVVTPTPVPTATPSASISAQTTSGQLTPTPVTSLPPGTMVMPDGTLMTMTNGTMYAEEADIKNGLVVSFNGQPVPYKVGVPVTFNFFVNQKPKGIPVLATDLQQNHTKLMHVIGVRSDMSEYFHVHAEPTARPGVLSVTYTFKKPGRYKIWSDIAKDNMGYLFGHPEIVVQGNGPTEEKQVTSARNIVVGNYEIALLTDGTIAQKRNTPISFDIRTLTGQPVEVENYLSAPMHLTIIRDDWKRFIHTHPGMPPAPLTIIPKFVNIAEAHDASLHSVAPGATIDFNVAFPEPGLYKAYAQFRPKGIDLPPEQALTAEFWLDVKERGGFRINQWWGLLIVSIVLMIGLSYAVKTYLKVKPESVIVKK